MLNYRNSEFFLAVPELSFVIYKVKMVSFCLTLNLLATTTVGARINP